MIYALCCALPGQLVMLAQEGWQLERLEVAGEQQILISNSRHPLMKVDPGLIPGAARLLEPGETGVGFTAVQESGIRQMDNLNADYIVLLQDRGEGLELRSLRKDAL